jgi:hypothetical protein
MTINLKQANFISLVKEEIEEENGKLIFNKGKYCGGKAECNGLFYINSSGDPIIKVAKGNLDEDEWVGVLIHEYCHFTQWREDCKVWRKFSENDVNFSKIFTEPVKNKSIIKDLIDLELDCEKRSVRIIKQNELVNLQKYCQIANAVLFKYCYLFYKNKWPTDIKKYNMLIKVAPKRLLANSSKYLLASKYISIYD